MKSFYLLVFSFLIMWGAQAAPGDTTVVQSHTTTQLANFGNYNAPAVFPASGPASRDIKMTLTLGKYQCAGNPQYCGDWDYTVQIYLITPTDTFELGRMMTPYANVSRFPWNWQHRYDFDVTDYAQYLKGNTTVRIHYSGYSGGFTANVKFTFIEGTPPRNVVKISRLWNGSFAYGNTPSIEAKMNSRSLTMPVGAQSAALKFNVTGHGANSLDNCSEFCSKYYRVNLNGSLIAQKDIWRNNCGSNELYPQTGTWIYDRANWCPGAVVNSNFHSLGNITAGSNFNVDVDFQPYTYANSGAIYTVEGHVIYYGPLNFPADAALEAIVSPNNHEAYFRSNPTCDEAKILVKNNGNADITSLELTYGITGGTVHTYTWNNLIEPGSTEEIILPGLPAFVTMGNGIAEFSAAIIKVNGIVDGNLLNNQAKAKFTPMPVWPNEFIIRLTTNNGGFNANTWKIFDNYGNLVHQRINNTNATNYADTLALPVGCYKLVVDDKGCNGLQWWAAPSQGNGSLILRYKNTNQPIPLKGYFGGDFGCGFNQAFRVQTALGVTNEIEKFDFNVFPVPAQNILTVNFKNEHPGKPTTVSLIDVLGQEVYEVKTSESELLIPVHYLPSGMYILKCQTGDTFIQKQVVITH